VLKIKGGESEIDKVGTSTGIGIDDKNWLLMSLHCKIHIY
jgi:hypothetical protein